MTGMTTQERIEDICKLSGMSEDIVRRVMDAERRSVAKSLRKGERANLIGRVVIRPEIRRRLVVGGEFENYIKLSATVAASLESLTADIQEFEKETKETENPVIKSGIITQQIGALT